MQKLCDFLALNDLWEVKRSNLFIRGDNTTLELRNSIKQQIKDALSGNDITKQELKYIKRHFEYLNVLSGGQYKNTVDFYENQRCFLLYRELRCILFARMDVNQFRLATWVQAQPAFL